MKIDQVLEMDEPARPYVLLALDPAASSGASIWLNGHVIASAEVNDAAHRLKICNAAIAVCTRANEASKRGVAFVVLREKWTPGGKRNINMWVGLGMAWGAWREHLLLAGLKKSRVGAVYPQTWQSQVLGTTHNAERLAMTYVKTKYGKADAGPNEACAICIGEYGIGSGLVDGLLPKIAVPNLELR